MEHLHFYSTEVSGRVVQVAGRKFGHTKPGHQTCLCVQNPAHSYVLVLQQIQCHLKKNNPMSLKKNIYKSNLTF